MPLTAPDSAPVPLTSPDAAEQEVEVEPAQGEREWGEGEDGDEWERRCYLLGQEHDSWAVRERGVGEWPPGDGMDEDEDDPPPFRAGIRTANHSAVDRLHYRSTAD